MANINIQRIINFRNREFFKVSSRKWNILQLGGPGVILANLVNNCEIIYISHKEECFI